MTEVLPATENDLKVILGWLEREYEEDEEGFWSNRNVITQSCREYENLWVIRRDGEAVAFQVISYGDGIVCVRKDSRKQGYGAALVGFLVSRALEDNVNVLSGECSPRSSLIFWEKMGFKRYGNLDSWNPTVRKVLHRKHDIPTDLPTAKVTIGYYPEKALHQPGVLSFEAHQLIGGLVGNGTIIGLTDDAHPRDLVVKVEVNGDELCFCKAKHDKAKAVGVRPGGERDSYYIDEIVTAT